MEIGKLDAASRLLTEAVRARLRGDDPLGVHLMTCSAMRITADLRKHQGLGQSSLDHVLTDEGRKVFWKVFYGLNSFVKHADKDPDATYDTTNVERMNDLALVMAIDNYRTLVPEAFRTFWLSYFYARFLVENPGAVDEEQSAGWLRTTREVWPTLDHDFVVEMARNPDDHAEELAVISEIIRVPPAPPPAPVVDEA